MANVSRTASQLTAPFPRNRIFTRCQIGTGRAGVLEPPHGADQITGPTGVPIGEAWRVLLAADEIHAKGIVGVMDGMYRTVALVKRDDHVSFDQLYQVLAHVFLLNIGFDLQMSRYGY